MDPHQRSRSDSPALKVGLTYRIVCVDFDDFECGSEWLAWIAELPQDLAGVGPNGNRENSAKEPILTPGHEENSTPSARRTSTWGS